MQRLNRRALLKRIGTALVAAPIVAVAATAPAQAAPAFNRNCEEIEPNAEIARVKELVAAYYGSPEGMADLQRRAAEYLGAYPTYRIEPVMIQPYHVGFRTGYDEGKRMARLDER